MNEARVHHSGPVAWFNHHVYSFVSSLGRALRRPWATLLTIGVMAVALALPLGLWAVLDNVARFGGELQQSREIAVFLKPGLDLERAQALATNLRGRGDVAGVKVKTPDEGLEELRERGGLGEAIDALGDNPLPSVLIVTPRGDETALAESLSALPDADQVQRDALWRKRLDGWLRFGGRVVWVLGLLLGLGALLVVGNTVRLDIQSRREEIGVLQLLGASDGFIRRPFLYLGAWYGLAAGALALGLLTLAAWSLRAPLADLAATYGSHFQLAGFTPQVLVGVIVGAALLGWLGAGLVTGHFLRQTRPAEA
jgi:cell division transport system permease protein